MDDAFAELDRKTDRSAQSAAPKQDGGFKVETIDQGGRKGTSFGNMSQQEADEMRAWGRGAIDKLKSGESSSPSGVGTRSGLEGAPCLSEAFCKAADPAAAAPSAPSVRPDFTPPAQTGPSTGKFAP